MNVSPEWESVSHKEIYALKNHIQCRTSDHSYKITVKLAYYYFHLNVFCLKCMISESYISITTFGVDRNYL